MRKSNTKRWAVSLLVVLLMAACGGRVFRQPQVTLQNVQIGGLGLRGGTLLVNLQVVNPNRFALNANELNYALQLNDPTAAGDTTWLDFAQGTYDQPFSVAAGDSAEVQIPVEFSYAGLGGAAGSLMRSGTFTYRATGSVDVRTPLGSYAVPFNKRGTISLMGAR
jgi:LEA14-like dessication related protein